MSRRVKIKLDEVDDPELNISSLIDVSFLLLIYFIVTSTLQKNEADLGIELPTTASDYEPCIDPLLIKIAGDGTVTLDGTVMEGSTTDPKKDSKLPELRLRLSEQKNRMDLYGKETVVVLAAADEGKTQRFVDVINALTDVEITSITMTSTSPTLNR